MLTADLVRVRRKGDQLALVPLNGPSRAFAVELADRVVSLARAAVGHTREELEEELALVDVPARERRLADGLLKLLDDRCVFDVPDAADAAGLRSDVFLAAAAARRAVGDGAAFDRDAILAGVGAARGLSGEAVDRALYADLRSAHVLSSVDVPSGAALVEAYEQAEAAAVLLRATRVVVDVVCASPAAYRALFRRLKFQRLLYELAPREGGGYRLTVDGPMSLFEAVTKYGLALALLLPALQECDRFELVAEVRWGKARDRLYFRLKGGRGETTEPPALPDEIEQLRRAFAELGTNWRVAPSTALIDVPGLGVLAPDLVFSHGETGVKVYLELLGYWSREAVWRRVDLVEKGISERVLFAVSQRLRVSEDVLPDDAPSALYVFKGVMSPRAVAQRLDALAERAVPKRKRR